MTDNPKSEQPKSVEKSTEQAIEKSSLDKVVDLVGTLAKTLEASNKSFDDRFTKIESSIKTLTDKAMETPTDLPLKPKDGATPDDNDIGDKVTAHNQEYHGLSQQAGIDDASPKSPHKDDQADLKMEQKAKSFTTTSTPRPSLAEVQKSNGIEPNPILKRFRDLGFQEGSETVAREIRKGMYHNETPSWSVV